MYFSDTFTYDLMGFNIVFQNLIHLFLLHNITFVYLSVVFMDYVLKYYKNVV